MTSEEALRQIVEAEESRRKRRWQAEQDAARGPDAPAATSSPNRT